jgi:hypothetical protein
MSCNCEGKTINIGMGCCQPVLGPVENYYTKWETERYVSGYTYSKEEIDEKTSGETSGCCITPEEVDEKIASAKTEIEGDIPSLDGYATEEYVSSYTYDKQTIDEKVAGGGTFDPTQYYNKTATDALLAEKVSESDFQTLSGVVTSHTSNSDIHVTSTDKSNWNAKPDVVMCTEAEWQNISGNTQTGTIYLVY